MPDILPVGHKISGERGTYQITQLIRSSEMGNLYKVLDISLSNRVCLVKEIYSSILGANELQNAKEAYDREVKELINIDHPGIPTIFDRFEIAHQETDSYCYYIVMQYLNGKTLAELAVERMSNSHRAFPEKQIIEWGKELCNILAEMHKREVIHRDIKPDNIVRMDSGRLVVSDFGLEKILHPWDRGARKDRSLGFAAPEQYYGETELRSDIYSLGATLYYLLTLKKTKKPFDFRPLRRINADLSEQTEDTIGKALEANVKNRYTAIQDFRRALDVNPPSIVCQRCQHENPPFSKYCGECGNIVGFKRPPIMKRTLNWAKEQIGPWFTRRRIIFASVAFFIMFLVIGSWAMYDYHSLNSSYYLGFANKMLVVYKGKPRISRWGFPEGYLTTEYDRDDIISRYSNELGSGIAIEIPNGSTDEMKENIYQGAALKYLIPIERGKVLYKNEKYQECIETLENDNSDIANYLVGMSYFSSPDRNVEKSTELLKKVIKERINLPQVDKDIDRVARFWLIKAYQEDQDQVAQKYLETCLELAPSAKIKSDAHFDLGRIYEGRNAGNVAIRHYTLAKINVNGVQRANAADRLGWLYFGSGQRNHARQEFLEAIEAVPGQFSRDLYNRRTSIFDD